MGSTKKASNWMAYFILLSILILIASCSVSAAEPAPVALHGDEVTVDASETAGAVWDGVKWVGVKVVEGVKYATTDSSRAKQKEVIDSTGKGLKKATNFVAGAAGDLAHWVEKKTK